MNFSYIIIWYMSYLGTISPTSKIFSAENAHPNIPNIIGLSFFPQDMSAPTRSPDEAQTSWLIDLD